MIKAIIFDLDGTLTDTLPLYIRSFRRALTEHGIKLTDREIVNTCFGKTEDVICHKLGIPSKAEEFKRSYYLYVKDHFVEGKLFKGVIDLLNLAKEKQIKLAIVSFAHIWYVNKMVEKLQLDKYFKVIIGFNDVKKAKPDIEGAILACNKLGVLPNETIMVGDSRGDMIMGKNAGCKTILFYPDGYERFYDLQTLKKSDPDKIIKDYKELKEVVIKSSLS